MDLTLLIITIVNMGIAHYWWTTRREVYREIKKMLELHQLLKIEQERARQKETYYNMEFKNED